MSHVCLSNNSTCLDKVIVFNDMPYKQLSGISSMHTDAANNDFQNKITWVRMIPERYIMAPTLFQRFVASTALNLKAQDKIP